MIAQDKYSFCSSKRYMLKSFLQFLNLYGNYIIKLCVEIIIFIIQQLMYIINVRLI